MTRQRALRYLCWKEARQVLPLVWMQLGLGICFQLLFLLQREKSFTPGVLLFAGMPSLFALGVGALLVGQEKERRTLDWLRWLPVSAEDVLRVKLAVAALALLVVWGLNLLLLAVFAVPGGYWPLVIRADAWLYAGGWEFVWPLQSVFFLVAGFATAWIFRSTLVALLALVPLAMLPGVVGYAVMAVYQRFGWGRALGNDPEPWMTVAAVIALSLVFMVVGWRRGMKCLAAEEIMTRRRVRDVALLDPWDDSPLWTRPVHAPMSMLIWQFVRQNQTALRWIVAMFLSALVLRRSPEWAVSLILLGTSWLGVLAFHGDALHERIRFLAERGISPAKTWWTRHAVPLSLLALTLLLIFFVLPDALAPEKLSGIRSSPPVIFPVVVVVLFVYAVSQAVGQAIRSATIAAFTAPVLAALLTAYGVLLVKEIGTPYWLIAILTLLPWLATFLLMRRWMDHRLGWGFWGWVTVSLGCGIVAPLVPLGWSMATQPTMPAEVRRQLTAEAQGYGTTYAPPWELVLPYRAPEPGEPPSASSHHAEAEIFREWLANTLSADLRLIRFAPHILWYLQGEARLARLALQQNPAAESQRERYRRSVALIDTLVHRLRLSWRIYDQDGADLSEIALLKELTRAEAAAWLGPELYERLVRTVGDDAGRQAARRRAVVMSWAAYRTRLRSEAPETMLLGGYSWQGQSGAIVSAANLYSRRRAADYLMWRMLQRLEESAHSTDAQRIRELAHYWGVPEMRYGRGLGGEFHRAEDPATFALPGGGFRPAPGGQWHAGWEQRGRELLDRLKE